MENLRLIWLPIRKGYSVVAMSNLIEHKNGSGRNVNLNAVRLIWSFTFIASWKKITEVLLKLRISEENSKTTTITMSVLTKFESFQSFKFDCYHFNIKIKILYRHTQLCYTLTWTQMFHVFYSFCPFPDIYFLKLAIFYRLLTLYAGYFYQHFSVLWPYCLPSPVASDVPTSLDR